MDNKAVVRVRLHLRISGQIIDKRRICIYDIAGSLRQDVPYRVVIRPVGGSGVLFPDIEALADKRFHLIRRAGDDQSAIVIAHAVGGDSCRIKFLRVLLHASDADIEDLQFKGLPSGIVAAAQLHCLGEGELISGLAVCIGVGKLRFCVIHIISGNMDI